MNSAPKMPPMMHQRVCNTAREVRLCQLSCLKVEVVNYTYGFFRGPGSRALEDLLLPVRGSFSDMAVKHGY